MKNNYFKAIVFTVVLLIPSNSISQSSYTVSIPKDDKNPINWGGMFCNASDVSISPNGKYIAIKSNDSLEKLEFLDKVFSSSALVLTWPDVKKNIDAYGVIPDIRSIGFTSENKVVTSGFYNNHVSITKNNYYYDFQDLDYGTKFKDTEAYTNFISADNYIEIKNAFSEYNQSKPLIDDFKITPNYDGLVAKIIFENKIYSIGSDKLYNLKLRTPNGKIYKLPRQINSVGFSDFKLSRNPDNSIALHSIGFYSVLSDNKLTLKKVPFYAKVAMDINGNNSGLIYDINKVYAIDEKSKDISRYINIEAQKWAQKGWLLQSVSTNFEQKKAVIIFKNKSSDIENYSNSSAYSFIDYNNEVSRFTCTNGSLLPQEKINLLRQDNSLLANVTIEQARYSIVGAVKQIPEIKYKMEFKEIGPPHNAIGILKINPQKKIKGTYISIRGGPIHSIRNSPFSNLQEKLLENGWQIVRVEYSGAINTSDRIFFRLRKDRDLAIKDDAKLLARYIKNNKNNKPVIIASESWGAALATELMKTSQKDIDYNFFIIPFSDYKKATTKDLNENSQKDNISSKQIRDAAFGYPYDLKGMEINKWQRNNIKSICNYKNTMLLFGENDYIVSPTVWKQECGGNLPITMFPDNAHEIGEGMENVIINKLDQLVKNDNGQKSSNYTSKKKLDIAPHK